jgi:uncharacterized cupredoxin-like copper-binding protein
VLATAEENQKHAEAMKMNPEMEHHDSNATRVPPTKTDEIVWNFTKAGEFEFACAAQIAGRPVEYRFLEMVEQP